jgi:hypothetical protein
MPNTVVEANMNGRAKITTTLMKNWEGKIPRLWDIQPLCAGVPVVDR